MGRRVSNLIGQKFGRLTVLTHMGADKHRNARWKCLCECGNEVVVLGYNLKSGTTKSCGCLVADSNTKHGMCDSGEYSTWRNMLERCNNPNANGYHLYGGRGITVCEEWHTFENFYSDMGEKPSKYHTIDRVDNNKGYCPSNCRWATAIEQANNRRNNVMLTILGTANTIANTARSFSLTPQEFYSIKRKGPEAEAELVDTLEKASILETYLSTLEHAKTVMNIVPTKIWKSIPNKKDLFNHV